MAALETGRFDTALFVLNMVTYNEQNRRLIQLAADLGVGMMLMRPLDHGALRPNPALRFALASGVDTVLCGMYSPLELDRNLALAGAKPSERERTALRQEAEERLGDRFDLKAFHNVMLGNGGVPLETLDRLVDDYIEERLAE